MAHIIEDTKILSGTWEIPMTDDVYQCFQRIIANRPKPKTEPMEALHWKHDFKRVCRKYNSIYMVQIPLQACILL